MKTCCVSVFAGAAAAQAHPSLVPHQHPHGVSMCLTRHFIVGGIFVLVAALVAYAKFGER